MIIKLLVSDFDGVFTNGIINIDNNNQIVKHYNIKDGMGIKLLKENNIKLIVLTGYKQNNSQLNILNHLNVEYYFNIKYKYLKLLSIINKLNIKLDEVAYIGDDINDVTCMLNVKLCGCPYNAVKECREISDFVSNKKGGDGCLREFIEYIINYNTINNDIDNNINNNQIDNDINNEIYNQLNSNIDNEINNEINNQLNSNINNNINNEILQQIKKEFDYQIINFNLSIINDFSNKIINRNKTNKIHISGVGKSENMSKHLTDILKSLNINCHHFNCLNLLHGDIGLFNKNDLVIFFSRSGNTKEIINLYKYIKIKECEVIGICCQDNNLFTKYFDNTIIIPHIKELNINISNIPNNSCMSQLLFINILSSIICNNSGIHLNDYKKNHPNGDIGNNLKKIKDVIITNYPILNLDTQISISNILIKIAEFKLDCCIINNTKDELIGIINLDTIKNISKTKDYIDINDINQNYKYEIDLDKYIKDLNTDETILIFRQNKLIGLINI